MNIEHFKKRLIHQHQKPHLETQTPPKPIKDDADDDASSNSSASSASSSQKQEKKETGVQSKIARKRAVCRSKFRHNSLKIFKLGTSIPTSLCKSKEPYNISTEKNLQLCCEDKPQQANNTKKYEDSVHKEKITEQIIHSIENNNKKDNLPKSNSNLDYISKHSNPKLAGKHTLPAFIPEIPAKRRRNSLSKSLEDERKISGAPIPFNNIDDYKHPISFRRTMSNKNDKTPTTFRRISYTYENYEILQPTNLSEKKGFDRTERISPDSTSTLETLESSLQKKNYCKSTNINSNSSMPSNTSLTALNSAKDYSLKDIPQNAGATFLHRETSHGLKEAMHTNKETSLENKKSSVEPIYTETPPHSRATLYSNLETATYPSMRKPAYSNFTNPTQPHPAHSNLQSHLLKTGDPQRHLASISPKQINPQLVSMRKNNDAPINYSQLPAPTDNPINLSVKEGSKSNEVKNLALGPVNRTKTEFQNINSLPFPEIKQQITRLNNSNASSQKAEDSLEESSELEVIKSMIQMTYSIMSATFSVDNLLILSYFYKHFVFVTNSINSPQDVKYYLEDVTNEVVSFVTSKLFDNHCANAILRQYSKQILEFDLQHQHALLKDVFHIIREKCFDHYWMRSFFMLLSRGESKLSKSSINNFDKTGSSEPKTRNKINPVNHTSYPLPDWTKNNQLPIPPQTFTQSNKVKLNTQIKRSYKPRGSQARKRSFQEVLNYFTKTPNYTPGAFLGGNYPTDTRHIPPKINLTPPLKEVVPSKLETLVVESRENDFDKNASCSPKKFTVDYQISVKKINDKEKNATCDNERVIVLDKSMEVTKTEKVLKEENKNPVILISNKHDVTVEKMSASDLVKSEDSYNNKISNTVISGEDLNLFKELLRQEDKVVYNKVLKKLIGVKETRAVPEVITIEDEEESTTEIVPISPSSSVKGKVSPKRKNTNPQEIVVIEDDFNTEEIKTKQENSDHNQNYINKQEVEKTKNIIDVISSQNNTKKPILNEKISPNKNKALVMNKEIEEKITMLPTVTERNAEFITPKIAVSILPEVKHMPKRDQTVTTFLVDKKLREFTEKEMETVQSELTINPNFLKKEPSKAQNKVETSAAETPSYEKTESCNRNVFPPEINKNTDMKFTIPERDEIEQSTHEETLRSKTPPSESREELIPKPTSATKVQALTLKIPLTDTKASIKTSRDLTLNISLNERNINLPVKSSTPVVENISLGDEEKRPYSQTIGYDYNVKNPEQFFNVKNVNHCELIANKEVFSDVNKRQKLVYTMPVGPGALIRSEPKRLSEMASLEENKNSISCKIKVNIESPYIYSSPFYPLDDNASNSPKNCKTPEITSPLVIQSPVDLISPISMNSGAEILAKSGGVEGGGNWTNWITEVRKKGLLDSRRSSDRRQSVETVSSVGSDYSPSLDLEDYVKIRIDTKWYRVKKTVMKSIPKGKMTYDRDRNYLIRYFDDNQLEQFIKNVNINFVAASDFLKQIKDRVGGYLSDNIFLTPFDVPETNEVIQLSSDVTFTKDDNISDPELYVEEVEKVEKFVPKDFLGFYKYVTGYQIIHNHDPISFQTFLTMHNTNRIKSFFKKYLLSILENK